MLAESQLVTLLVMEVMGLSPDQGYCPLVVFSPVIDDFVRSSALWVGNTLDLIPQRRDLCPKNLLDSPFS
jgi:hypothetical protein